MRRRVEKGLPVGREVIERLEAQTDRIARLVRELGDAGRLESGFELPVQMEPLDLREVVEHVVTEFRQVAESRSHAGVRYAVEALLPAAPCPLRGDRHRLEQVVAQFVDNAFKYSPHGGTVRLELAPTATGYRLTVRDEGMGIPPAELSSVTRAYVRASNASPVNFPGLGLGLAIAQQLTERHGGRIEIASELGRGTTVTLSLPAAEGAGV
jgi:signal transduction histidine kinase